MSYVTAGGVINGEHTVVVGTIHVVAFLITGSVDRELGLTSGTYVGKGLILVEADKAVSLPYVGNVITVNAVCGVGTCSLGQYVIDGGTLGSAASLTGLGSLTGSICIVVSNSYTGGESTIGAGCGLGTGSCAEVMSLSLDNVGDLNVTTHGTGVGGVTVSGTGNLGYNRLIVMRKGLALSLSTYRAGLSC